MGQPTPGGLTKEANRLFNSSTTPSSWDIVVRFDAKGLDESGKFTDREYAYFGDLDDGVVDPSDGKIEIIDSKDLDRAKNSISYKVLSEKGFEDYKSELYQDAEAAIDALEKAGVNIVSRRDDFEGQPYGGIRQEIRNAYRAYQVHMDALDKGDFFSDRDGDFHEAHGHHFQTLERVAHELDFVRFSENNDQFAKFKDDFINKLKETDLPYKSEIAKELGVNLNVASPEAQASPTGPTGGPQ